MTAAEAGSPPPEERRNALLRRVDWRYLLSAGETPSALALCSGDLADAVELAFEPVRADGEADLVVVGRASRARVARAGRAVVPGGEVAVRWRSTLPGGAGRLRRRLENAGFTHVRLYWPGPVPWRQPHFWLPLAARGAIARVLADRPARSRFGAVLRAVWGRALRIGSLTPLWAIARAPGGEAPKASAGNDAEGEREWLLLTGGKRSINKVVALGFRRSGDAGGPDLALKIARVSDAEPGLRREAEVLRELERERPEVPGIPRVLGEETRSGRLGVAESPVLGRPLLDQLTPASFEGQARAVTDWLAGLAGRPSAEPRAGWWPRLVGEPLEEFERTFGPVAGEGLVERARRALDPLGDLPLVCEHRDCAPWNVLITPAGDLALLDWESAEPRGLPALDLVYFLANSAFVLDRALESGLTRESYGRLLDPGSATGAVAEACLRQYAGRVGSDPAQLPALRLLCWIVHSRSDYRHLELKSAGTPSPSDLSRSFFLGLVEVELGRAERDRR